MKGEYADRECPECGCTVPGKEIYCPKCKIRVGRVNIDPQHPGSYKGYIKK
ncbi:MAG: hypothetical protein ACXQTD_00900 [Candidatus Syntropharchaeia archaeon]